MCELLDFDFLHLFQVWKNIYLCLILCLCSIYGLTVSWNEVCVQVRTCVLVSKILKQFLFLDQQPVMLTHIRTSFMRY